MLRYLRKVIVRDLEALRAELRAYPDEHSIWQCPPGISNSAGTLTLHLIGNLRHYIGAQLGGKGYARNRDAEFMNRDVPLADMGAEIDAAIVDVDSTLAELEEGGLPGDYPQEIAGTRLRSELFLIHLASHLAYHLGQVDYHRRLVTGDPGNVGAQSIAALRDQ